MFPPCNMLGPVLWRWLCTWGGADGVVRITRAAECAPLYVDVPIRDVFG